HDEATMYQLSYVDRTGSPGTDLTFFHMPFIGNTYRGTNAITRIGLLVPTEESLLYWKERLQAYAITHDEKCTTYAGRQALHFTDPEGLRLVFVVANGEKESFWQGWDEADIPIDRKSVV